MTIYGNRPPWTLLFGIFTGSHMQTGRQVKWHVAGFLEVFGNDVGKLWEFHAHKAIDLWGGLAGLSCHSDKQEKIFRKQSSWAISREQYDYKGLRGAQREINKSPHIFLLMWPLYSYAGHVRWEGEMWTLENLPPCYHTSFLFVQLKNWHRVESGDP